MWSNPGNGQGSWKGSGKASAGGTTSFADQTQKDHRVSPPRGSMLQLLMTKCFFSTNCSKCLPKSSPKIGNQIKFTAFSSNNPDVCVLCICRCCASVSCAERDGWMGCTFLSNPLHTTYHLFSRRRREANRLANMF